MSSKNCLHRCQIDAMKACAYDKFKRCHRLKGFAAKNIKPGEDQSVGSLLSVVFRIVPAGVFRTFHVQLTDEMRPSHS